MRIRYLSLLRYNKKEAIKYKKKGFVFQAKRVLATRQNIQKEIDTIQNFNKLYINQIEKLQTANENKEICNQLKDLVR